MNSFYADSSSYLEPAIEPTVSDKHFYHFMKPSRKVCVFILQQLSVIKLAQITETCALALNVLVLVINHLGVNMMPPHDVIYLGCLVSFGLLF